MRLLPSTLNHTRNASTLTNRQNESAPFPALRRRGQRTTPPPPVTRFIIDHSVWARLGTSPAVVRAFRDIVEAHSPASIWVCPPTVTEIGFSARNGSEHDSVWTALSAFRDCPRPPTSHDALVIQNRLWHAALVRAVGAIDTVIAAYALANDATVLHYDSDFEHVATVMPQFRHEWIVPRGTL